MTSDVVVLASLALTGLVSGLWTYIFSDNVGDHGKQDGSGNYRL